jgi:hypothetical protein
MSSADKTKLNGIAAGAQVNVATNLSYTTAATTGTVVSSTGTNAVIPAATTSLAGLMTDADKTKLNGIAAGAQVNVATNLGSSGTGGTRSITSSTGTGTSITYTAADVGAAAASHTHAAGDIVSGVLSADRLNRPSNGNWWNAGFIQIQTDGVVEVGKYFDFHATSAATTDFDYRLTAVTGGLTGSGSFSASIFYDSSNTAYYVDPASTEVAVNVQGDVRWGISAKNNGNPRSARIGYSGGNYGSISYGIDYTETSSVHTYAISDIVSRVDLFDGIRVWSAPVGTVGSTVSWTEVLDARRNNSNMLFKGSVVLTASNYNSYSPTLTGTGASGTWGINVTGSAGSTSNINSSGGVFSAGPVLVMRDTDSTGAAQTGYISFQNSSSSETGWVGYGGAANTDFGVTNTIGIIRLLASHTLADNSMRSPIFYDSNNTAYYADPASTSNFVGLTVANTITGSISGNAATVTNGVYTTGTQTIGGAKTFSSNVTAPDFIATSDARIKFERQPITDALSKVCKMRGETFIKSGEVRRSAGYIAQDLEAVLPEGVYQSPEGVKQVSNSATIGLLIEAVKELQKEVAGLKAQLEKK